MTNVIDKVLIEEWKADRDKVRKETEAVAHKIIEGLNKRIADLEREVEGWKVRENELRKANQQLKKRLVEEFNVDYRELI